MRAVKMGGEAAEEEGFPSTPGKVKMERGGPGQYNRQLQRCFASTSSLFLWALFLVALTASYLSFQSFVDTSSRYLSASWGGLHWERRLRASARPRRPDGLCVLVTGAAGFVGSHASLALRRRGDGVLASTTSTPTTTPPQARAPVPPASHGVFVVEGDLNDAPLLARLFAAAPFTHVLHLAAQAGVRYALENPASYVAQRRRPRRAPRGLPRRRPQPAVVWARLRPHRPPRLALRRHQEGRRGDHPRLQPHLRPLRHRPPLLHRLRALGPPDMAYFAFARAILQGKPITVYRGRDGVDLARDFTYIDDVVRGCVASLDTARRARGPRGAEAREAQYRIYNLGNTSPVTVPALVGILERHLKAKARRNVVEMPGNGDVPFTHANISLARAELGYKPTTNLDAGLKKFVKWYLSYYGYTSRAGSGPNNKPNAAAAAAAAV
ncbi:UDP-glucuronate 4-epimerase 1 [Ananas comosus]|uniref:UDP-glucuronate 4-epimerase 1 n=1 Tax=Ananas comosus TaxID=4615 RepID=A0A199VQ98_ANACO|nr:UDP-glucuronate 4-epimerase 1 [Ananas comosus]